MINAVSIESEFQMNPASFPSGINLNLNTEIGEGAVWDFNSDLCGWTSTVGAQYLTLEGGRLKFTTNNNWSVISIPFDKVSGSWEYDIEIPSYSSSNVFRFAPIKPLSDAYYRTGAYWAWVPGGPNSGMDYLGFERDSLNLLNDSLDGVYGTKTIRLEIDEEHAALFIDGVQLGTSYIDPPIATAGYMDIDAKSSGGSIYIDEIRYEGGLFEPPYVEASINEPTVTVGNNEIYAPKYVTTTEITGSVDGVLTNYPILVTIIYDSDYMNEDFSDIRFYLGETKLNYFMKSKTDGISADFLVKIPTIPANPDTLTLTIYGSKDPLAVNQSNPELVLEFYDSFIPSTLNPIKWSINAVNSMTYTTNDYFRVTNSYGSTNTYWIYDGTDTGSSQHQAIYSIPSKLTIEWDSVLDSTLAQMGQLGVGLVASDNTIIAMAGHADPSGSTDIRWQFIMSETNITDLSDDWVKLTDYICYKSVSNLDSATPKIIRNGNAIDYYFDGIKVGTSTVSSTPSKLSIITGKSDKNYSTYMQLGNLQVSQYTPNAPVVSEYVSWASLLSTCDPLESTYDFNSPDIITTSHLPFDSTYELIGPSISAQINTSIDVLTCTSTYESMEAIIRGGTGVNSEVLNATLSVQVPEIYYGYTISPPSAYSRYKIIPWEEEQADTQTIFPQIIKKQIKEVIKQAIRK